MHSSSYRHPTLSISYNDGRTKARVVPVVYSLNRLQQVLEYEADQLGEYRLTFAKYDTAEIVIRVNIITYRNDKGKKSQQKRK